LAPSFFGALTPSAKQALKYPVNVINCQNLGKTKGNYLKYMPKNPTALRPVCFVVYLQICLQSIKSPWAGISKKQNTQCPSFETAAVIFLVKK
jgi:hypothetical protein